MCVSVAMILRSTLGLALVVSAIGCASSEDAGSNASPVTDDNANLTSETKLLDCNTFEGGGGPDQQVTVIRIAGKLVLRELTNHGSTVQRPLDDAEFASRTLKLREESPGD